MCHDNSKSNNKLLKLDTTYRSIFPQDWPFLPLLSYPRCGIASTRLTGCVSTPLASDFFLLRCLVYVSEHFEFFSIGLCLPLEYIHCKNFCLSRLGCACKHQKHYVLTAVSISQLQHCLRSTSSKTASVSRQGCLLQSAGRSA